MLFWALLYGQNPQSPIHFAYKPIDFKLESSETAQHHAPETMAGGVAIFDYNNDGYLDIYFANGADIATLEKSAPKYSNRLFENDGRGNFKDVTEKAGLAGAGFDNGVAIGDYDNDGYKDIFIGGVHQNRLYHNNGNGTFTDVTAKAGTQSARQAVRTAMVGRRGMAGREQRRVAGPLRGELSRVGFQEQSPLAKPLRGSSTTVIRSSTRALRISCSSTRATEPSRTFRRRAGSALIPVRAWE